MISYLSDARHWSFLSMLFYELLALFGFICFYFGRRIQSTHPSFAKNPMKTPSYIIWIVVWTIFATFRYVGNGIGGTDAAGYIMFFEDCNSNIYSSWMEHVGDDLFFKYFNKTLRYLFSDYHVYFAIIYGIMTAIMVNFIDYFCPKNKYSTIPAILIFHIYLRGFNTIRSNFAFCLLLAAIIMMAKQKYRWMIGLTIASVLTHKSMVIFAMFIPFYYVFTKRYVLNVKNAILLLILSAGLAGTVQSYATLFLSEAEFEGAYSYYANRSGETNFTDNYWKIAFEQIVLGMMMLLFNSSYKKYMMNSDSNTQERVQLIWLLCVFDILLIPVCFILSIWRAPEFFHMARTVMWCVIFWILFKKYKMGVVEKLLLSLLLFAWIYNRVEHTWADSGLMPYIFEPYMLLKL